MVQTFIDFLFVIDILVSFVTPFERHDGTFETNFKKISRNYSLGNLTFDLIAIIPFQFATLGTIIETKNRYELV